MIYWFQNLPLKSFEDDAWKPIIPYNWLRQNFMAAAYILQFVLYILLRIYLRTYTPKYDITVQSSI